MEIEDVFPAGSSAEEQRLIIRRAIAFKRLVEETTEEAGTATNPEDGTIEVN